MKIKKLIYQIKPPCPKCPYTLGLVHTIKDPCPECKANGYQTFERLKDRGLGKYMAFPDKEKRKD